MGLSTKCMIQIYIMRTQDLIRLITLAAIWGSSFIFMRILAPAIGAIWTADLRIFIGGLVLIIYLLVLKKGLAFTANWKHYLVVGFLHSGIPFLLYSFAALHIPASYSVILNATAPIFGAIFSVIWLGELLTKKVAFGLFTGITGVALMSFKGPIALSSDVLLSMLACIGAAICYGLTGIYIKKFAFAVDKTALAGCSQLLAGSALLPVAFSTSTNFNLTGLIVFNILALAIMCSSIAYLLYYRPIVDIGPTKALTVTFLMPVFGVMWGHLFLGELITLSMIVGMLLIVSGTYLVGKNKILLDTSN